MRILTLLLLVAVASGAFAQAPLRVLVTGDAPFVVPVPAGGYDGISIRLFKAVAQRAGFKVNWNGLVEMHEGVEAVATGRADVLVGPVGITSARAQLVTFSQPYYFACQGIASLETRDPRVTFFQDYLVVGLQLVAAVIVILIGVGMVVWLLERRRNPDFPDSFWPGMASGMWLAVVTITTVGYGDRVPRTRPGRTFAGFMMICGMLFASTLTATMTSLMAEYDGRSRQLDRPSSLSTRRVATVASSSSAPYAAQWAQDVMLTPTLERAMQLLMVGQVDAVVFHYPETLHWSHAHPEVRVHIAAVNSAMSQYGFAFGLQSQSLQAVNQALLQLTEEGAVARIQSQWMADLLPDDQGDRSSAGPQGR